MADITPEQLEDMLDRAAKKGASEALRELGLQDQDAANDIRDMRGLLEHGDTLRKVYGLQQ